ESGEAGGAGEAVGGRGGRAQGDVPRPPHPEAGADRPDPRELDGAAWHDAAAARCVRAAPLVRRRRDRPQQPQRGDPRLDCSSQSHHKGDRGPGQEEKCQPDNGTDILFHKKTPFCVFEKKRLSRVVMLSSVGNLSVFNLLLTLQKSYSLESYNLERSMELRQVH
ncbi:hypothetical protein ACJX0J_021518, partial [Zea mays]